MSPLMEGPNRASESTPSWSLNSGNTVNGGLFTRFSTQGIWYPLSQSCGKRALTALSIDHWGHLMGTLGGKNVDCAWPMRRAVTSLGIILRLRARHMDHRLGLWAAWAHRMSPWHGWPSLHSQTSIFPDNDGRRTANSSCVGSSSQ